MNKTFLKTFLILLIPVFVILLLPNNDVFAAAPPVYNRWAGLGGSTDSSAKEFSPDVLTSIGIAGGDFLKCSLYIKTVKINIVNGVPVGDFDRVTDWQRKDCSNGGAGEMQYQINYEPNYVRTAWNWQVSSNSNSPIYYSEQHASLDKIGNNSANPIPYYTYLIQNPPSNIIDFSVPSGSAIVAMGLSVFPGNVIGMASQRISLPSPPAVSQIKVSGGQISKTPVISNSTVGAETNTITQFEVSNAIATEGSSYIWSFVTGSGAYVPKDFNAYSAGQYVDNLNNNNFNNVLFGSNLGTGPFLKIAFSDIGDKKIKVTKGNLETNFTINVTQPATQTARFGCDASAGSVETGKPVTINAFGGNLSLDKGHSTWTVSPDGTITSSNNLSASAVFTAPGQKIVNVSYKSNDSPTPITANCPVNVVAAPSCVVAPTSVTNAWVTATASGGDGKYTWSATPNNNFSISTNPSSPSAAMFDFTVAGSKDINVFSAGLSGKCSTVVSEPVVIVPPPVNQPTCSVIPAPGETNIVKKLLAQAGIGNVGEPINLKASGGDNQNYLWDFLLSKFINWGGTFSSVSANPTTATFTTAGSKLITVTSGGLTGNCVANVIAPVAPTPPPSQQTPATCTIKPDSLAQQRLGVPIKVEASGGNGNYSWQVLTGGSVSPASSNPTWATFTDWSASGSSKLGVVQVTSGGSSSNCQVTLFESDVCPNINGTQTSVPGGRIIDSSGNCVVPPVVDVCPNIREVQSSPPGNMTINANGDCVVPSAPSQPVVDNNPPQPPVIETPPPAAPTCVFSANPPAIALPGQTATLSWDCQNVNSCTIDNGIGSVASVDQKNVKPSKTTPYNLTCSGPGGNVSLNTSVTVGVGPWLKEIIPIW